MWRQVLPKRLLLGLAGIGAVCVLALLAFAWRPAIAPIEPPPSSSFARGLVAKGEVLASAGDCITCHTAPGGALLAGRRPLLTPFGTVYSTNITPDPETGIGRWSEAAFTRALREGVARDGSHLLPAFPFDHFTKLTDGDILALYAYLMTAPPVRADARDNKVPFPLDIRALQAVWKWLYFDEGPYRPNRNRSPQWNRGAYLAEGLAHCGACHTRRNVLGAEQVGHPYGGEMVDGWIALPLDVSPSPARWTKDDYVAFLRGGTTVRGRAIGPMYTAVKNLAALPDSDIEAIATYFVEFDRATSASADAVTVTARARSTMQSEVEDDYPARLYAENCGSCHEGGAATPRSARSVLALSSALWSDWPYNFIRVVLDGVGGKRDAPGPPMPPFRDVLSDDDIIDIGNYLRRTRTTQLPWSEEEHFATQVREDPLSVPWKR
jgi:mono/diheme cytochrome c family protein